MACSSPAEPSTHHCIQAPDTLDIHHSIFRDISRASVVRARPSGYTSNVKRWHYSPQRHRWMALSLLEAESRMRRLSGYEELPKLKQALKDAIPDRE